MWTVTIEAPELSGDKDGADDEVEEEGGARSESEE
jgi:hypothetical protein